MLNLTRCENSPFERDIPQMYSKSLRDLVFLVVHERYHRKTKKKLNLGHTI